MAWAWTYYDFWEEWSLYHKVTFDGENKLILINYGETSIDVQVDIYSDWKEWVETRDYIKFEAALRTVGGDPTVGSAFLGDTYFLINGWRIRTWEGNHELNLEGNLFVDGGGSLFVPTIEPWTVQTSILRSNLVDIVVVSGSSTVVTESFTSADRIILDRIDTIAKNLPNSGSLTDLQNDVSNISSSLTSVTTEIQTGFAATSMAAGGVVVGSADQVTTDIVFSDNLFDDMHIAVTNAGGARIVRKIDTYLSSSGTFVFESTIPFTPASGSAVTILSNYNNSNGRMG